MSSIPSFIKDSGSDFKYERQLDRSPSDKGPPTCRVLKKGLGNNIWFTQFYWPFGGDPITVGPVPRYEQNLPQGCSRSFLCAQC